MFDVQLFGRVDSLSVLLILLYFLFYNKFLLNHDIKYLYISSIFIILAIFTKQSAIFYLFTTGFFTLFKTKKINLFYFYILPSSTILILILLFNYLDLSYSYKNIVLALNQPIDFKWFWNHIVIKYLFSHNFIVCVGLIGAFYLLQSSLSHYQFLGYTLFISFFFSSIFSLKYGSESNYFSEFNIFSISFIGIILNMNFHKYNNSLIKNFIILFIFLTSFQKISYSDYNNLLNNHIFKNNMYKNDILYQNGLKVFNYINSVKKDRNYKIFIDFNAGLIREDFLNFIFYEHSIMPSKDIVLWGTSKKGSFNYKNFLFDCDERSIHFLIKSSTKKSKSKFMDCQFSNYYIIKNIGPYIIYSNVPYLSQPNNDIN